MQLYINDIANALSKCSSIEANAHLLRFLSRALMRAVQKTNAVYIFDLCIWDTDEPHRQIRYLETSKGGPTSTKKTRRYSTEVEYFGIHKECGACTFQLEYNYD